MLVFIAVAVAGLLLLVGGALFGHDHDHDIGHDIGHGDHGHEGDHGQEPTVSIFSPRVIGTFLMGFGGTGAIAQHYLHNIAGASFVGVVAGFGMAGIMYLVLMVIYGQQANSIISASSLIGKTGVVTIPIDPGSIGQVEVGVGDLRHTYLARSFGTGGIRCGAIVTVKSAEGSQIEVEEVETSQAS